MALETNELFSQRSFAGRPRMVVERNRVGTFAVSALASLLKPGLAIAYNGTNWVPYAQPSDQAIHVLTADGTPATAGTMLALVDGLAIEVAFDTTAVAMAAAINAVLLDAGKDYTVVGVDTVATDLGDANHVATFTFSENAGALSFDVDLLDLTGNAPVLSVTDAGTQLDGSHQIRGFVAHSDIQLSATDEVQGDIMLEGEIHRDDANTAAMRALMVGSPSEAEVDIALKATKLRDLSIHIRGLAGVN